MEEKQEEEPLLFYLGITCAQKRLYLSFSQVDAKGRMVLPSLYLNELMRLVKKEDGFTSIAARGLIVPQLEDCFEKEEIENRLSYTIWRSSFDDEEKEASDGIEERALTASIFNQLIMHDQFRHSLKNIFQCAEVERERELFLLEEDLVKRRNKASVWTGLITHEGIRGELKRFFEKEEGRFWSPSYLELYISCPFRFFLQRLLRVFPLRVPGEEIEKVDEGSLIHKVLERFFKVSKEKSLLPIEGSGKGADRENS
jgi:ATP-dependent helicase/DNAse subunit B